MLTLPGTKWCQKATLRLVPSLWTSSVSICQATGLVLSMRVLGEKYPLTPHIMPEPSGNFWMFYTLLTLTLTLKRALLMTLRRVRLVVEGEEEEHEEGTKVRRRRRRGRRDTRFVLLGHSLAGHIVMEMAASRQDVVRGIAFIASIGLRPHRGVGGTMFFPLFRRLGQHIDHPYAGPLMRRALVSGYVHMGGFSKTSGASDVIHSHRRVAALDFPSFIESVVSLSSSSGDGDGADTISDAESTGSRVVVDMEEEKEGEEEEGEESDNKNTNRRSRNSTMHAFLTYAANDPHIEESVQQELSRSLPAGPRLRFSRGGHNIQKTKSVEIAAALKTWIENIIITDEEPRSDKVVVEEKDESHRVCNK